MPARDNFQNAAAIVEYCDLALFASLPDTLLVNQSHCLLHYFTDEHRVIGKHTGEYLQVHTLTTNLRTPFSISVILKTKITDTLEHIR